MLNLRENLTSQSAKMASKLLRTIMRVKIPKGIHKRYLARVLRNANQRVYPVSEISRAVYYSQRSQISGGYSVPGEVGSSEGLNINPRQSKPMITEMWTDGPNGYGKLKILSHYGTTC